MSAQSSWTRDGVHECTQKTAVRPWTKETFAYPRGLFFGLDNTVSTALSGFEIMQQPRTFSRILGMDERRAKLDIVCSLLTKHTAVHGT
jgi:hypothetical protein